MEDNRPLRVFKDKCCKELAYPGIFLDQPSSDTKQRKVNVRCAAMWVENIFYGTKKLQMKIL